MKFNVFIFCIDNAKVENYRKELLSLNFVINLKYFQAIQDFISSIDSEEPSLIIIDANSIFQQKSILPIIEKIREWLKKYLLKGKGSVIFIGTPNEINRITKILDISHNINLHFLWDESLLKNAVEAIFLNNKSWLISLHALWLEEEKTKKEIEDFGSDIKLKIKETKELYLVSIFTRNISSVIENHYCDVESWELKECLLTDWLSLDNVKFDNVYLFSIFGKIASTILFFLSPNLQKNITRPALFLSDILSPTIRLIESITGKRVPFSIKYFNDLSLLKTAYKNEIFLKLIYSIKTKKGDTLELIEYIPYLLFHGIVKEITGGEKVKEIEKNKENFHRSIMAFENFINSEYPDGIEGIDYQTVYKTLGNQFIMAKIFLSIDDLSQLPAGDLQVLWQEILTNEKREILTKAFASASAGLLSALSRIISKRGVDELKQDVTKVIANDIPLYEVQFAVNELLLLLIKLYREGKIDGGKIAHKLRKSAQYLKEHFQFNYEQAAKDFGEFIKGLQVPQISILFGKIPFSKFVTAFALSKKDGLGEEKDYFKRSLASTAGKRLEEDIDYFIRKTPPPELKKVIVETRLFIIEKIKSLIDSKKLIPPSSYPYASARED